MSEKYHVYLDIFLSADAKIASVATKGGLNLPRGVLFAALKYLRDLSQR